MVKKLCKILLLTALFLTSCSIAPAASIEFVETGNYEFTQEDINEVVYYALERLEMNLPAGWTISLVENYIIGIEEHKWGFEVGLMDGYTLFDEKQIMVYPYQPCLAASSLIHELGHIFEYSHGDPFFDRLIDIQDDAVRDLCGPNYPVVEPPEPSQEVRQYIHEEIEKLVNKKN